MPVRLGPPLTDDDEVLLRHATEPGWIVDGRPTRQLFLLRPVDRGYLSVERETLAGGAQAAWENFNARLRPSVSVWGVTVGEVHAEQLVAFEQPSKKLPAHAVIGLSSLDADAQQAAGARLTLRAADRGRLAPPDE